MSSVLGVAPSTGRSSASKAFLALSALLLCLSGATAVEDPGRRLLNATAQAGSAVAYGFSTRRGRLPYMAALVTSKNFFRCGGTLIHSKLVLTAAHCVLNDAGKLVDPPAWALVGVNNWLKDSPRQYERIRVKKVEWHPSYRHSTLTYDAAILVLERKAKARPVSLATARQQLRVGTQLLAAGFGATNRAAVSPQLMAAVLPVQRTNVCSKIMLMPSTHFCVGGGWQLSALCEGDSGGPLIQQSMFKPDVQVGLFSFMPGTYRCGDKRNNLGAATNVKSIRPWLDSMAKKHGK